MLSLVRSTFTTPSAFNCVEEWSKKRETERRRGREGCLCTNTRRKGDHRPLEERKGANMTCPIDKAGWHILFFISFPSFSLFPTHPSIYPPFFKNRECPDGIAVHRNEQD
ncbi:hypothetical protein I7I53_08186 [Histoplasma capsulatum var. duboisii H88]|uniref:Uncharacterized protein n=1 Tax=Ajellomyces capsulatus (strain H88) TaxID=544711 RepID=A0A8A1LG64_AJEC8|nr:hypothetical protein I7I53_08186 [Histoplasma capsulatum var. duboisii H88]